jgi:hypothetical protein
MLFPLGVVEMGVKIYVKKSADIYFRARLILKLAKG